MIILVLTVLIAIPLFAFGVWVEEVCQQRDVQAARVGLSELEDGEGSGC